MSARGGEGTYYEVLEVGTNASFEEIEASYQRLVSYMSQDSLALYSMLDEEEALRARADLDEAYRTLCDPDRRTAYDRIRSGEGSSYPTLLVPDSRSDGNASMGMVRARPSDPTPVVDIDAIFRAGEGTSEPSDVLPRQPELPPDPVVVPSRPRPSKMAATPSASTNLQRVLAKPRPSDAPRRNLPVPAPTKRRRLVPSPEISVSSDTEFGGALLRRLRESAGAGLDEVSDITKISKRYLQAIEEHDFTALPAAVYLRGFVVEYARVLGLDSQRVAQSYMSLYQRYRDQGA